MRKLKKLGFVQFTLGPWMRHIQRRLDLWGSPRTCFSYVDDLKSLAPSRGWVYRSCQPPVVQRREPSRTIAEDVLTLAKNGKRMIRSHRDARLSKDVARGKMYYSHLLGVTCYPVFETFTCEIPDVFLWAPEGGIVTNKFEILTQSAVRGLFDVPPVMKGVPEKSQRLEGTHVCLLGCGGGRNYGHWLLDVLPRLTLLQRISGDLRFITPYPLRPFHAESLELLGVRRDKLVLLEDGWYRLENVILCHAAQRSIVLHGHHIRDLRNRLVKAVIGTDKNPRPWRRVYISRTRSKRKIINERELVPVLKEYGFESCHCEDLSLRDQITLFSEATAVLGHHGAGMNNQIFCNPGAKIIEIYNPIWWHHCVCRVANLMGHEHWHTFGKNIGCENDTYLSPAKLDKLLAYAFRCEKAVEAYY